MAQQHDPAQCRQPAGLADDAAFSPTELLRAWRAKADGPEWPDEVPWEVEATTRVVHACLDGVDLPSALRALADQRFDQAATPDEFALDVAALAACLTRPAAVTAGQLVRMGEEAARWVVARDHTLAQLADPLTAFRTRTAFLADLTYRGSLEQAPYVWVARWRTDDGQSLRMSIADRIDPLGAYESACYLGPCSLSVLVSGPERGQELEALLAGIAELDGLETVVLPRPEGDPPALAEWLVSSFPELVREPLP
ncbi:MULTISPECIES: hypothetical protein [Amycolatopsis]|uniref:Uncharacterized protein n=2 Tax=Amycolatopsis TaxID=1813 RepID=A0A1I3PZL5_9PSEU|nr:hypothetical protein [Amycolatopsis sacchari]SFJ26677.1 hypothetical protein SAMN05421835_104102 [Amycolatopsis sacchari]